MIRNLRTNKPLLLEENFNKAEGPDLQSASNSTKNTFNVENLYLNRQKAKHQLNFLPCLFSPSLSVEIFI